MNVERSTPNVQRGNGYRRFGECERFARRRWRLVIANSVITCTPLRDYHESFGEGAETSERGARAPRKLATSGGDFALAWSRGCGFVHRADHCSGDNHLNDAADARKVCSSRSAQPFVYIHDVLSRGFVNGPDDCACNRELDHSTGDPAEKDFKC